MKAVRDNSDGGFGRRRFLGNASALSAASFLGSPGPSSQRRHPRRHGSRFVHDPSIVSRRSTWPRNCSRPTGSGKSSTSRRPMASAPSWSQPAQQT